jgi:transposase
MPKQIQIQLSRRERQALKVLLNGGLQPVRTVLRALALGRLGNGESAARIAADLRLSRKAVWQIGQRFRQEGLQRALYDQARPGAAPLLDAQEQQRIIALVCSQPPAGRARWTVRLLAEEAIKRKLVPRVGRETIRVVLQSHDTKPWREKNVVRSGTG